MPTDASQKLTEALKQQLKALAPPPCNQDISVPVSNSMVVQDCNNISDPESMRMSREIVAKVKALAATICEENASCPNPELVGPSAVESVCNNRQWTASVSFTIRCVA